MVATVTQFPGASIGAGAPSERAGAPDTVGFLLPRPLYYDSSRSRFSPSSFSLYFFLYTAGLKPKGTRREKNRNLLHAGIFFLAAPPSSRETSSAKCPTKIGICREYRIPEVRSGLSGGTSQSASASF